MLRGLLEKLLARQDLTADEASLAFEEMMTGRAGEALTAALLVAWRMKGETAEEVYGAARTLRRHMRAIPSRHSLLLDTCGTGGDGLHTFNISTAAAIVTAAAGVPVAKHGNRGVSSRSGSADVLQQLGVCIELDVSAVSRCLDELGLAFCFAPLLHPSMRHAQPVRRALGIKTIFNLLGPLANPAGANRQLLGVSDARVQPIIAHALRRLGTAFAWVVRGEDGMDEVSLGAPTQVLEVAPDGVRERRVAPNDFGLAQVDVEELQVRSPAESAAVIENVLRGEQGPARQVVLANAAAALYVAGKVQDLKDGVALAAHAIDSRRAWNLLEQLVKRSNELYSQSTARE